MVHGAGVTAIAPRQQPKQGSHSAGAACTASIMREGAVLTHQYKQLVPPDVGRCKVFANAMVNDKHL